MAGGYILFYFKLDATCLSLVCKNHRSIFFFSFTDGTGMLGNILFAWGKG